MFCALQVALLDLQSNSKIAALLPYFVYVISGVHMDLIFLKICYFFKSDFIANKERGHLVVIIVTKSFVHYVVLCV